MCELRVATRHWRAMQSGGAHWTTAREVCVSAVSVSVSAHRQERRVIKRVVVVH